MDFSQAAAFALSVVAILLHVFRFKREITVIGPKIKFLTRRRYDVDADHGSLREYKRWHYQFDLIFMNQGDRNGILIIDDIETDLFETVALMKGNVRYERQYPIPIQIKAGEFTKTRFGGMVYQFEENKKDETLRISYRTWQKRKKHFWQKTGLIEVTGHQSQKISLLQPKRTKQGTDERLQKSKDRVTNAEDETTV